LCRYNSMIKAGTFDDSQILCNALQIFIELQTVKQMAAGKDHCNSEGTTHGETKGGSRNQNSIQASIDNSKNSLYVIFMWCGVNNKEEWNKKLSQKWNLSTSSKTPNESFEKETTVITGLPNRLPPKLAVDLVSSNKKLQHYLVFYLFSAID